MKPALLSCSECGGGGMVKAKPVIRNGVEYDGGVSFCRCRFRRDSRVDQAKEQPKEQVKRRILDSRIQDWNTRWEQKQDGGIH